MVAAPSSGSGKTVVTLGLLAHLKRTGVAAASLKAGPDYIDPAFHARATGRDCFNFDTWAMRPPTLSAAATHAGDGAGVVVCEGVMGLFDGASADEGATSDIARLTGWPVVLVVDARAQGASAAALVKGFATFRDNVRVEGVIFNRVGSERHQRVIRAVMERDVPDVRVLGMIPSHEGLALPSRHLGLVQAMEHDGLDAAIQRAATIVQRHVDVDALTAMATGWNAEGTVAPLPPLAQRIAVARDEAFAFAYPMVLEGWRAKGAQISFFSPLQDQAPAPDAGAVYLPGGYPELHAYRLASADRFKTGLSEAARRGAFVYGECGGYMVLGRGMTDADGTPHVMAGLLPLSTTFAERKLHLGYRRLKLIADTPLGPVHGRYRGHEFHYATVKSEGPAPNLFEALDADDRDVGRMGLVNGTVFGSFAHLIDREAKS
ncbi:MAG: cobyrinate a,c-diamide synthase [Alphaproteobacteria bacterium]|nr:cobyrinate a,c-diamide synthase [Alphaproteobacteria bacterium]